MALLCHLRTNLGITMKLFDANYITIIAVLLLFCTLISSVPKKEKLRVCLGFSFEANAAKFYSEQGVMREHSRSYVTEEQRSSGQNLARAARSVKSEQALNDTSCKIVPCYA